MWQVEAGNYSDDLKAELHSRTGQDDAHSCTAVPSKRPLQETGRAMQTGKHGCWQLGCACQARHPGWCHLKLLPQNQSLL